MKKLKILISFVVHSTSTHTFWFFSVDRNLRSLICLSSSFSWQFFSSFSFSFLFFNIPDWVVVVRSYTILAVVAVVVVEVARRMVLIHSSDNLL